MDPFRRILARSGFPPTPVLSSTRLLLLAGVVAAALALIGFGGEYARFGLTSASAQQRLEADVRQRVDQQAEEVRSLATRVAAEAPLIAEAASSRERLSALFSRLAVLAGHDQSVPAASATVYVPAPPGAHRVLAWSEGPAAAVGEDRLAGPAALFVAPGATGVRLVFVQPITIDSHRVAVAVAETVLASGNSLDTAMGPVAFLLRYEGAGAGGGTTPPGAFVITSASGAPLLEVDVTGADLTRRRREFRADALTMAALPIVLALSLWALAPLLARRRGAPRPGPWAAWSILAAAVVAIGAALLARLIQRLAGPPPLVWCVIGAAALGLCLLGPGTVWWRQRRRLQPTLWPVRFLIEHAAGGVVLALAISAAGRVLASRITAESLDTWQSALFPFRLTTLFEVWSVLLIQVAICWSAAGVLALLALRWRVRRLSPAALAAVLLWACPTLAVSLGTWPGSALPISATFVPVAAAIAFAVLASPARRRYRRTTHSMRLLLGFSALLAPLLAIYPMAASVAERTTRDVIATDFAPAVAGQPETLRQQVVQAQQAIDRMTSLPTLITGPRSFETLSAFEVWKQSGLERSRVTSDIELYGPDRGLVSRFALNFPEYLSRAQTWPGNGCEWTVSGEVTRFAAVDRAMLHAERGICDAHGMLLGAVVLHVAPTDYQALAFLPSSNPYSEVLGSPGDEARNAQLPDLQLVVYGWSLQPLFVSDPNRATWSIANETFERLYQSGASFWTDLEAEGQTYQVFFSQNRAGIYALGYPTPTLVGHATRLAELTALAAVLFVAMQLAVAFSAPLMGRREAPLRVLLHEVRTSFFRKLFLFFVVVAIGPVLLFALAFGAYMNTKFRADVESEARSVVAVAQRVFEEVTAAEQPAGRPQPPPTDDVMVWIRQVIDQDVNLFDGPELRATSQRDLFNSGLLPTRTPAGVYRTIALDRLPTYVADDQLGRLPYLVAAAPINPRGGDTILTVPLAPRQREIEREIDELNRGVLAGSVLVILFAAGLGASLASRVSDPVARLTRATRQIAAGHLDVRIVADTADELGRLVENFDSMTATLVAQRAELARTNQLKAWNEMARQVAHEIKNPLTPLQLATEHLARVHEDRGRPLGAVFDQCVRTVLGQVRLLRQIASEFANFAGEPTRRPEAFDVQQLIDGVMQPYQLGVEGRVTLSVDAARDLPHAWADRTLVARALTNLLENAIQAMPGGGALGVTARAEDDHLVIQVIDSGVGMDSAALAHAFEPYFSTKTAGSGLGLANARRNVELQGGTLAIASEPGRGTTVTMTLPVARPAAAPPPPHGDGAIG